MGMPPLRDFCLVGSLPARAVLEGHHVVEEIVTHAADNLTSRQAAEAETRLEAVTGRVRGHGGAAVEVQAAEGTDSAAAIVAAVRECLVARRRQPRHDVGGPLTAMSSFASDYSSRTGAVRAL